MSVESKYWIKKVVEKFENKFKKSQFRQQPVILEMTKKSRKNDELNETAETKKPNKRSRNDEGKREVALYSRILAPMVGGSELAFRLLCRKYGAELCYTPMMSSEQFAVDEAYRCEAFQTCEQDRPLVAHFSANDPQILLTASLLIQDQCDAIDINLGCPQRVAHAGHFGSYLMDHKDRPLVLSMVKKLAENLNIPVFVKIRIYDDPNETIEYCKQLQEAGAALIAVHARYRVNLVGRSGPGARDGAAILEQVKLIKQAVRIPVISNGNVISWDDVVGNAKYTQADGVMVAEGILDNPALFLPGLLASQKIESVQKKLAKIEKLSLQNEEDLQEKDIEKINSKTKLLKKLEDLSLPVFKSLVTEDRTLPDETPTKLQLAKEYLGLVNQFPVPLKSVIFHLRRMCKEDLCKYQLMNELLVAPSIKDVKSILKTMLKYEKEGGFTFDPSKDQRVADALKKKQYEEGKRKRFEGRMTRKAKREGKPLNFYLDIGAAIPTLGTLEKLKAMPVPERLVIWKKDHSQHCLNFHLSECNRGAACAFLHSDPIAKSIEENPSWLEERNT